MKALTLTQPWATLVAIGAKCIETRGWSTDYRGPGTVAAVGGDYAGSVALPGWRFAGNNGSRAGLPAVVRRVSGSVS